ncbi:T9SS type A sorting domain-containing protein [Flavobacterium aquicola]|uniref:Putative secreted protein (Por secretion system target) n=1 Tax=Flavobacterium aquicola TaxID=1682742 RepID=A0A3E0EIA0_9FLAO|nr:T9SS type A sorting domain-containing protein [Flavobacterium aquicola]REG97998.1 putative secreted protein (Por secretion system target) [Flavobacterium aquicola]
MKKKLLLLLLLPILTFSQNYSDFSQSISLADLTTTSSGGAGGSISIINNTLTANFSGGWASSPMRVGVIKHLNITPVISYLDLGSIWNNTKTAMIGYFAKIENNDLIFFTYGSPTLTTGCSLNFTKTFPNSTISKITFTYDNAGNQTSRTLCLSGCTSKSATQSKEMVKEIAAITDDDLEKFSSEDVISYYPNPVKEELFLKWQQAEDNSVSSIVVYGLDGQVLKTYLENRNISTQNISFQSYPIGIYIVALIYTSGEQKTIKIIKQ